MLALGLSACGPGVTLTLRDGSQWSGRPRPGDATHVEVQTFEGRYVFCKRDVADADHAGNGALIAGTVLTVVGSAALIGDASSRNPDGGSSGSLLLGGIGLVATAAGIVTGVLGLSQLTDSKSATGLPASADTLQKPCSPPVRYVGP